MVSFHSSITCRYSVSSNSEIDARWLLLAGVALGLGILTKFTVAAFGALLFVVVARYIARSSSERRWLVGLAALARIGDSRMPAIG